MSASHNSMGATGENWIEICAEDGVKLIPFDPDGKEPVPDCSHCSYCLIQSQGVSGTLPSSATEPALHFAIQLPVGVEQKLLINDPEHYWPQSRGPPIRKENSKMILNNSLATDSYAIVPVIIAGAA